MSIYRVSVLCLLFSACTERTEPAPAPAPAPTEAAVPQVGVPDDTPKTFDVAAIDAWASRRVKAMGLVGAQLAIVRGGKLVLSKGYGKRSVAADGVVTPETAFAIGSVTKQLTCASVLLLAEDGKLSIEDKVAKYYPDLTRASDISLNDLMSHLSGYPDYYPLDFVDERLTKPTTPETVVHEYGAKPLDFEPRTRFSYSNTGFLIAGRIIERVSGQPFGDFLGQRIFKPLGMTRSSLVAKDLAEVATGHTAFALGETEVAAPEAEGWLQAAGGAYATAEDLTKWDVGLADRTILKQASYDVMTSPRKLASGAPVTYACGLAVTQPDGETLLQHNGAVSGFLAWNAILPRTRSAVVFLSNSDHIDAHWIHSTIVSLLMKAENGKTIPAIAGQPPAEVARELFKGMQKGTVDRSKLGEAFSQYMSDARLKTAAPRLAMLGDIERIDEESFGERGGAENATLRLRFKTTTVRAILHRSPDGKVQQFLLYRQ